MSRISRIQRSDSDILRLRELNARRDSFMVNARAWLKLSRIAATNSLLLLPLMNGSRIYFASGSVTSKVVPWLSLLATLIVPPWARTIQDTIDSPSPLPEGELESLSFWERAASTR